MPRLKILLSAYACQPGRGSELGVGWHWALEAARDHEVWVLTREYSRPMIEAALAAHPNPNLHFVYHPLPRWLRFYLGRPGYLHLYYVVWQCTVPFVARRLHRQVDFDVVHHVTYNTVEVPGFLAALGPPFIWGPVGGAQLAPASLRSYYGRYWAIEWFRGLRKRLTPLNPWNQFAARRADTVLAANADTEALLGRLRARRVVRELETGIDLDSVPEPAPPAESACLTVLWAGQHVPRKGPELAVDILAELHRRGVPARLRMAGDGPLRRRLEQRVLREGLGDRVELLGNLPHREMQEFYRSGEIFLFSSLQDTSGNVILEAMARGIGVVTLDHHGAAEIVDDDSGVRIAPSDPTSTVRAFADALEALARDPQRRHSMGLHARERVRTVYPWAHKGHLLRDLYASAVRRRQGASGRV